MAGCRLPGLIRRPAGFRKMIPCFFANANSDAIAAARGPGQVGEPDEWTPHVSVAYSNSTGPMEPYLKALEPPLEPVSVDIADVQLIVLGRDAHLYEWQTRAVVPLV